MLIERHKLKRKIWLEPWYLKKKQQRRLLRPKPQEMGLDSEKLIAAWLSQHVGKNNVALHPHGIKKFDLLCCGKRIEAKASKLNKRFCWFFNLHRRGILDETNVDFYIFRLEKVPGFKAAIHLVIPAPIGKKTILISMRSLMGYWGKFYNRIDFLLDN